MASSVSASSFADQRLTTSCDSGATSSRSSSLLEAVQQMEPRLLDTVMPDGRLLAVPCEIHGRFTKYYASNLALAEFSPENLPSTYDEFYDFILNWKQAPLKNHGKFMPFFDDASPYLLADLVKTVITESVIRRQPLSFDTDEFRGLLQKCRQAAM